MPLIPLATLRRAAREALAYVAAQPDVREAEAFVASNGALFARLNYTSHIPSNGVEEPKSLASYGLGLRVAFASPEGTRLGFGSEPSDLSLAGVGRAFEKARRAAVADPDFVSLPKPTGAPRTLIRYHDPQVMRLKDRALVDAGWVLVEGALEVFSSAEELLAQVHTPQEVPDLGLILGGDITVLQERVALASSHFPRVESDESTMVMAFLTAMVEAKDAKGSGFWAGTHLAGLSPEPGGLAARNAVRAMDGVRLRDGVYRVIFGPQAIMDILQGILLPSLHLDTFHAGASTFQGKLTRAVASELLNIYDDGARPGYAASKGMTDEGLPTGRTDLVRRGHLVGLLANHYRSQQVLRDPRAREKLGVDPKEHREALAPRNGFRFGGGGRHFDRPPGVFGTNVVIEGTAPLPQAQLLGLVGDGLYIGRLWYTYPINGLAAGDFTGTVVADSFLIENGRLGRPIRANAIRINDNIHNILEHVLGVGDRPRATLVWASDEITHTPEIAVANVHVQEIGEYLQAVYPAG
jgi:PmbA protein